MKSNVSILPQTMSEQTATWVGGGGGGGGLAAVYHYIF